MYTDHYCRRFENSLTTALTVIIHFLM